MLHYKMAFSNICLIFCKSASSGSNLLCRRWWNVSDSWRYKSRVTLIQINDLANTVRIHFSSPEDARDQHWDVFVPFLTHNFLDIPLSGSRVIFPGYHSLARLWLLLWKDKMEIPVNGSELSPCLICWIPKNFQFELINIWALILVCFGF